MEPPSNKKRNACWHDAVGMLGSVLPALRSHAASGEPISEEHTETLDQVSIKLRNACIHAYCVHLADVGEAVDEAALKAVASGVRKRARKAVQNADYRASQCTQLRGVVAKQSTEMDKMKGELAECRALLAASD